MRPFLWLLCALLAIDAQPMSESLHPVMHTRANDDSREENSVCYPVVGCFDSKAPFNNAAGGLPQDPTLINTHFLLFTKTNRKHPEVLDYDADDQSISQSQFNSSKWLRIIVHGFTNNRHSSWITHMTDELLKLRGNDASDVLVVDWGHGATFPLYNNAAANIRLVGKQISLLLKKLQKLKNLSYDKVHCIGHSLGAHTCAYASNGINHQMARISGLDPAGPFFEGKHSAVRLDQKDAKFVDVIHTNTEIALGIGLGSKDPSGHVDFYVNGGKHQPGCPSAGNLLSGLFNGQSESSFEHSSCSHGRAHGYFIESINSPCSYTAYPCQDHENFREGKCLTCDNSTCAKMGFHAIQSAARGVMYLATKSHSPFCGHHYYVELSLEQSMPKTIGEIFVAIYSNYEMLTNVTMTHKSNVVMKGGDRFRHVFSFHDDLGAVDYAVVYFNKGKTLLNIGGPYANKITISDLRIKSAENTVVFSGACKANVIVPAYKEQPVLLNARDCAV